jgi:hypothetical protein
VYEFRYQEFHFLDNYGGHSFADLAGREIRYQSADYHSHLQPPFHLALAELVTIPPAASANP